MFQKITALLILIIAIVGLSIWWLWPKTQGTITFLSSDGTRQVEEVTSCTAGLGSQPIFFGIHLKTAKGTDVFVHDGKLVPSAPTQLELTRGTTPPIQIDPKTCSTLSVALTWGEGGLYTDIRNHADGKVSARCLLTDGTALEVEANIQGCKLK